jgi:mono/diheme cytochrome c family protein
MHEVCEDGLASTGKWVRFRHVRRSTFLAAGSVVMVAAMAGAAIFGYIMTGPADRRPSRVETLAANSIRRIFVPLHVRRIQPPPAPSPAGLLEGRKIYRQRCALCHGGGGKGGTAISPVFYPPVPDVTATATQRWSDRELFWTIQNGIRMTGMPAWRSELNDQQTWDVVAYMRRLADQDGKNAHAKQGGGSAADLHQLALQTIEDEGCRDCHTIDGTGATIGPNLSDEWARGRSDEWLLGHFRHPAAVTPGTPMPSFDYLSDEQLKALVRYLQDPNK